MNSYTCMRSGKLKKLIWQMSEKIFRSCFEISSIQNYWRVFEIYLMPGFLTTLDPIFGISGISLDQCHPIFDWKVHICCLNIGSKAQFFDVFGKMKKTGTKGSQITKYLQLLHQVWFNEEFCAKKIKKNCQGWQTLFG